VFQGIYKLSIAYYLRSEGNHGDAAGRSPAVNI
jgi:hypothetical protein